MIKSIFNALNIDFDRFIERVAGISIKSALKENKYTDLFDKLKKIKPDLSNQYSRMAKYNDYWELKIRSVQTFQCDLMLRALESFRDGKVTVVDIGDSAGTHMLYLKELTKKEHQIRTISVNLDERAIDKIKACGMEAIHCRAEDINLGEDKVDLFVSFEMVEHLHNPAIFFRRMAKKSPGQMMIVTVPYLKKSRVGLHNLRLGIKNKIYAEDEHIFELSPEDWTLILLHSGWRIIQSKVFLQYPSKIPILSGIFSWFWRKIDYEGFWGVILEKDLSFSDLYMDWEN